MIQWFIMKQYGFHNGYVRFSFSFSWSQVTICRVRHSVVSRMFIMLGSHSILPHLEPYVIIFILYLISFSHSMFLSNWISNQAMEIIPTPKTTTPALETWLARASFWYIPQQEAHLHRSLRYPWTILHKRPHTFLLIPHLTHSIK